MFKLPLLQPHLTGANGVENKHGSISKYSPFLSSSSRGQSRGDPAAPGALTSDLSYGSGSGSTNGALEIKDWEAQGREITSDVAASDRYKSLALHAEVKLKEALERCARISPAAYSAAGEERPNKLKTAVCCQLLGEFAELCGPFSGVLGSIRDELVRSVYSAMYSSERGTLSFDQLPWFTVAERLEAEKELMLEERERFTQMLNEQQAVIERIEQQMSSYQRAMQTAQLDAAQLRNRLDGLVRSEETARAEARTGREELKRVRKEWLRLRDELEQEQGEHKKLKVQSEQDASAAQAQIQALSEAVRRAHVELDEAQRQLATRLPAEAVSGLQQQVKELQALQAESKRRVESLEGQLHEAQTRLGSSTPRPSWRALRKFGIEEGPTKRTQDLVAAAAEKLAALTETAEASASRAAELELVLVEDPPPQEVTLAIATDASAYFITEQGGAGGAAGGDVAGGAATVSAEGLGRGPHVPRCLRRRAGAMVEGVLTLPLEATEALCLSIWQAKHVHGLLHPPQHLQSFLYTYFSARLQQQHPVPPDAQPPGALHRDITQQCYSLYHSLATHARQSPLARLFRAVLAGQLPEAAPAQLSQLFAALAVVASGAAAAAMPHGSGGGAAAAARPPPEALVPTLPMLDALGRLAAGLPGYKASRLKEAYTQAVHPAAIALGKLQDLLRPLVAAGAGYDAAAVAAAVRRYHAQVAAAIKAEEAPEEQDASASMRRMSSVVVAASPAPGGGSKARAASLTAAAAAPALREEERAAAAACLGNGFVAALLQLFVEHHEAVAAAVEREVGLLAAAAAAAAGEEAAGAGQHEALAAGAPPLTRSASKLARAAAAHGEGFGGELGLTPADREVLGVGVGVEAVAAALRRAAGLGAEQAAQAVAAACAWGELAAGAAGSPVVAGRQALAVVAGLAGKVWSGVCLAKLLGGVMAVGGGVWGPGDGAGGTKGVGGAEPCSFPCAAEMLAHAEGVMLPPVLLQGGDGPLGAKAVPAA